MKHLKEWLSLGVNIFKGFERKHLQLVSAGLAYYFLMSLVPALVLLTAVAAYLPMKNGTQSAISFMAHIIPQQSLAAIEPLMASVTTHRTGLLWFGIISTLWLTSVGAKAMIAGLDITFEVRTPRPIWMNRFLAFGLTFAVGMLLLLAIVLTVTGPIIEAILGAVGPAQYFWTRIWPYLHWLLAGAFTFAAIELLFLFAPNLPLARRTTIPGAMVAAIGWLALAGVLGAFFNEFGNRKLDVFFGVFATPIALLVWLKSSAAVILIGAQLNVSLESRKLAKPPELLQDEKEAA